MAEKKEVRGRKALGYAGVAVMALCIGTYYMVTGHSLPMHLQFDEPTYTSTGMLARLIGLLITGFGLLCGWGAYDALTDND